MDLLTFGTETYTGDSRYTVDFQYPNNWRLQIKFVNSSDEGEYGCQISTHPPKFIHINLHINGKSTSFIVLYSTVGNKNDLDCWYTWDIHVDCSLKIFKGILICISHCTNKNIIKYLRPFVMQVLMKTTIQLCYWKNKKSAKFHT